jgi:hypothetical protein
VVHALHLAVLSRLVSNQTSGQPLWSSRASTTVTHLRRSGLRVESWVGFPLEHQLDVLSSRTYAGNMSGYRRRSAPILSRDCLACVLIGNLHVEQSILRLVGSEL